MGVAVLIFFIGSIAGLIAAYIVIPLLQDVFGQSEEVNDYEEISLQYSKAAKDSVHKLFGVISDYPITFTPIGKQQPDTSMHIMD